MVLLMVTTIIRAARLIDGSGAPPVDDPVVVVRGSTIAGVFQGDAPAELVPDDASTLDLADCTLLPGLIDTHVHLNLPGDGTPFEDSVEESDGVLVATAVQGARVALDAGITTLRDTGGRARTTVDLRRAFELGYLHGSRLVVCGQSITITGGHTWYFGGEADGVDGVRRKVREMVKLGVDFIKVMGTGGGTVGTISHRPSFTRDELNALADEAHRLDRKITVHCLCAEAIEYAIDAGVDQIEHASFIVADGGRITQRYVPEVGEKLAASGIPVTGTLSVAEYVVRTLSAKEQLTRDEEVDLDRWQVMLEDNLNQFRSLHEAGVTFVAGTDAGWRYTPFDALPIEIELMQRGGMPTLEAIAAGSGRAASVIGVDGKVGTVREGLEADIIAVEGDPLQNLDVLRNVRAILQGGRVHNPSGAANLDEVVARA
jgi:imidazolonepropionase-like amidohydrolase